MVLFIDEERGFPVESLFVGPIIVARPMSCIAKEVGTPARLRPSCSSFENDLHSGPDSDTFSVRTKPHLPQKFSPVFASVTSVAFPHRGHFSFGIIFFTMSISFYLAYFLSKDFYAKKIVRTILILPWATSMVITATAYKLILNGQYGFLNKVLYDFNSNFRNIAWLGNVRAVMPCLIFIGIMVSIPFATLALMAAFQGIPQEILEAAEIDGASAWKKLIHIMIPYIKPTIGVVMLVNIIYDFNSFPIIWVLTKGGPVYKTHILVTYLYEKAFFFMEFGSASSIAIIVFIIIFILSFLYVRLFHRKEGTI